MSRRLIAAAAMFILTALSARADRRAEARPTLPLEDSAALRALFALAPGVVENADGSLTATAFTREVIVARIGPDGKLIKAFVRSEEEARKFLTAPVEKVQPAKEQEQ